MVDGQNEQKREQMVWDGSDAGCESIHLEQTGRHGEECCARGRKAAEVLGSRSWRARAAEEVPSSRSPEQQLEGQVAGRCHQTGSCEGHSSKATKWQLLKRRTC